MSKFNDLISGEKPVLVDFFATWCGPCKMMGPILDDVSKKISDKAIVLKVDVDKNREAAAKYNVQGVPTLIIFKQGKIVWRQSGVVQANQLISLLQQHAA